MHLTLRQLRYLVAVADAGSMARAAESLHVASTALSLQIKAMEDFFQIDLFHRHSRGVQPTEAGMDLYTRARQILALVEDAERALVAQSGTGVRLVRLGVPPAIARIIGVEAFVGVNAHLRGLSLQVEDGWSVELLDKLIRGDLDFVVGYNMVASDAVRVIDLVEDRFIFVCAPDAATGGPIELADALQSSLVFYGEKSVGWKASRTAAQQAGLPIVGERHVRSIDVWRSLLCQGLGTSITSFGAIADEVRRGELAVREIDGPPILQRIGIAYRSGLEGEPWVPAFVDFIVDLILDVQSHDGSGYLTLLQPA